MGILKVEIVTTHQEVYTPIEDIPTIMWAVCNRRGEFLAMFVSEEDAGNWVGLNPYQIFKVRIEP